MPKKIIGVIGGHSYNTNSQAVFFAEQIGKEIARRGLALVCGGFDGIMEAACKGCKQFGGTTIGIIKGNDLSAVNPFVDYAILTSMDVACNNIIIWTAAGIVALDGRFGTLNEVALALDFGKPIVLVGRHELLRAKKIESANFHVFRGYTYSASEILNHLEWMIKRKNND